MASGVPLAVIDVSVCAHATAKHKAHLGAFMLLVCSPKSRQAWRGGRGAAGGLTAGLCTPQGPAAVARFRAATRRADTCGAQQGTWEERLASFAAHQIRSDPSPVYGGGARAALDAFQRLGLPALLAHVRSAGAFPGA